MMTNFWNGFEKRGGIATKAKETVKAVFKGLEKEPPTLNYGKGGNVFTKKIVESPHTLDYSRGGKLEQEFIAARDRARRVERRLPPRPRLATVEANRARINEERALPGRFARDEGVGTKALK